MTWLRDRFETLVHWISERDRIRLAKEAGKLRPWTEDEILATWRFCNVNRCDDTVTKWIFENIIAPHADSPTLWFNLVIARLVNWPESLGALGYFSAWNPEWFIRTINQLQGKVWTGAYMIPAGPSGMHKAKYLADGTLMPLWEMREAVPTDGTCASWFAFIEKANAMGDFLTNQVITDMKYTPVLANAPDWSTFVVAGPGTQRGLNRFFGRELKQSWRREEAQAALLEVREAVIARLPYMTKTMRDLNNLSNCFCEFDKYLRVQLGEGKPRSRYVPADASAFPPRGWVRHPNAPGWFYNYGKECITEMQLRKRMGT